MALTEALDLAVSICQSFEFGRCSEIPALVDHLLPPSMQRTALRAIGKQSAVVALEERAKRPSKPNLTLLQSDLGPSLSLSSGAPGDQGKRNSIKGSNHTCLLDYFDNGDGTEMTLFGGLNSTPARGIVEKNPPRGLQKMPMGRKLRSSRRVIESLNG